MAVTDQAIAYFANDFREVTGIPPKKFVCPITLRDDPEAALCDGHILCQKIKTASRTTVPQRADVDNKFGSLFERDFVTFANIPETSPEEILKLAKNLQITGPTGEKMNAFFAGPDARERYQQVSLYDNDGNVFATPYLRSHFVEAGLYKQMEVEWFLTIHR